jgi:hypothetical protein
LKPVEIGRAALLFLEANPEASHTDVAKWLGFKNSNSGRVKVSESINLITRCDDDLIKLVEDKQLGLRKALKIRDERNREALHPSSSEVQLDIEGDSDITEITTSPKKAKKSEKLLKKSTGAKKVNISVGLETLIKTAKILELVASMNDMDCSVFEGELDRKAIMKIFDLDLLTDIHNKAS